MAADGLMTLRSAHDFDTTLDCLLLVLKTKGFTVFATGRCRNGGGAQSFYRARDERLKAL